ncbi:hypothetical protein C1H46_041290 [Malus baccata]|uniref:EF-hand domain-containing protein n=1 Tax=Malus baccata TaxID=106549 RepID=A0A540KG18_MALBA|nr:hypothetical protein C1H46_041290 [Malus baccata]
MPLTKSKLHSTTRGRRLTHSAFCIAMCPSGRTLSSQTETTALTSDFRPAFNVLDADRDGKISKDDLRAFYAGFSSSGVDENLIGSMMSVADSDNDGFVQYDEFERVLAGGRWPRSSGVMEDVFKVMDKDGDGKLSHEDLKSYMSSAGFAASDEDIKAMLKLGGGDENQGVTYAGLLKILAVDQVGQVQVARS